MNVAMTRDNIWFVTQKPVLGLGMRRTKCRGWVIFTKWEGSLGLLLVRLVRQSDHWAAIQQTKQRCVPTGAERWPVQEHPETCEAGPWGFRRVAVVFKSPATHTILVKKKSRRHHALVDTTCGLSWRCLLPGLKKNQVDERLGWSNEAPSSQAATICNLSLSCTLHPTRQWSHFSWPSCRMFSSSVLVVPPLVSHGFFSHGFSQWFPIKSDHWILAQDCAGGWLHSYPEGAAVDQGPSRRSRRVKSVRDTDRETPI